MALVKIKFKREKATYQSKAELRTAEQEAKAFALSLDRLRSYGTTLPDAYSAAHAGQATSSDVALVVKSCSEAATSIPVASLEGALRRVVDLQTDATDQIVDRQSGLSNDDLRRVLPHSISALDIARAVARQKREARWQRPLWMLVAVAVASVILYLISRAA